MLTSQCMLQVSSTLFIGQEVQCDHLPIASSQQSSPCYLALSLPLQDCKTELESLTQETHAS